MGLFNHPITDNGDVIVHNHNKIDVQGNNEDGAKVDEEAILNNVMKQLAKRFTPKYKILQISTAFTTTDTANPDWFTIPGYVMTHKPSLNHSIILKCTLYISSNQSSGNFYFRFKASFKDVNGQDQVTYPGTSTHNKLSNQTSASSALQVANETEAIVAHSDRKIQIVSSFKEHTYELQALITDGAELNINHLNRSHNNKWNGFTCSTFSIWEVPTADHVQVSPTIDMFHN